MARLSVAGICGVVFSFVLIIAPIETMVRIKLANGVGERSVYNYVFTFANAVALVGFGAPWGWLIAGINLFAMAAEFLYTLFYYLYAQGPAKRKAGWAIVGEAIWTVVMLILYLAGFYPDRNEQARIIVFGVLTAATGCVMYAAMIPDLCAVLRTQDVAQQSIILLLAALGSCTSWAFFSVAPLSLYMMVPNVLGIALAAGQSGLWVFVCIKYRNAAPQPQPQQNNNAVAIA